MLNYNKKAINVALIGMFIKRRNYSEIMVREMLVIVVEEITKAKYHRVHSFRRNHKDAINDIIKRSDKMIIFLKNTPKGWWLAIKFMREFSGKLYILNQVGYMDIPSRLMELSFEKRWKIEYEKEIEDVLKKWGVKVWREENER